MSANDENKAQVEPEVVRSPETRSASGNTAVPVSPGTELIPRTAAGASGPPALNGQSSSAGGSIDPWALWSAFRRRWFLATSLGLLFGAAAAAAAWYSVPAPYKAFAELRIRTVDPGIDVLRSSERQARFEILKGTMMKLIKSPYVLNRALRSHELVSEAEDADEKTMNPLTAVAALASEKQQQYPVDWLEEELGVSSAGTEFIRISLSGQDPQALAVLVNAVTNAYLEEAVYQKGQDRDARLRKLQKFHQQFRDELETKLEAQKRLSETLGTTDPETQSLKQQMEYEYYSQLRQEYVKIRFQLMQARIQLEAQQAGSGPEGDSDIDERNSSLDFNNENEFVADSHAVPASEPAPETGPAVAEVPPEVSDKAAILARNMEIPESVLEHHIRQHPEYQKLDERIQSLEHYVAKCEEGMPANHPRLVQSREQLRKKRNDLELLRNELRPEIVQRMRAEMQARGDASVAQLRRRIELLKAEKEGLERQIEDQKIRQEKSGGQSFELEKLRREIEHTREIADRFHREIEALRIEREAEERISLFRKADVPRQPDTGKKYKMAGLAGFGTFGLLVAGIVLLEFRTRRISSFEEIVNSLRLRVMGSVPLLPRKATKASANGHTKPRHALWRSALTESVDSARTILLRDAQNESMQVVMLTSAVGGEGKTTLSCHLATSLARAGRKVVLLDCDIRRPSIHRVYGLEATPGFCEVLRGEVSLKEAIRETSTAGLTVLPAGDVDGDALNLLAENGGEELFRELKEQYDFVLVDSAPVLPVTDSLLLAQEVDAVMFAIRRDVSRLSKVAAARRRLEMLGIPLLGTVVIGLHDGSYDFLYPFSYKNGDYTRHYRSATA